MGEISSHKEQTLILFIAPGQQNGSSPPTPLSEVLLSVALGTCGQVWSKILTIPEIAYRFQVKG